LFKQTASENRGFLKNEKRPIARADSRTACNGNPAVFPAAGASGKQEQREWKKSICGTSSGKKKSQDARELLADDVMIQMYICTHSIYTSGVCVQIEAIKIFSGFLTSAKWRMCQCVCVSGEFYLMFLCLRVIYGL